MSRRWWVDAARTAATFLGLIITLSGPDQVAAAPPAARPLLQPLCNTPVAMLGGDAALTHIRLSKPLQIEDFAAPENLRIPAGAQIADGKLIAATPVKVTLFDIKLPAYPSVELEGAGKQLLPLSPPVTVRLGKPAEGQLLLPPGTVVSTDRGETTAAKGSKGQLSLAAGDLGQAIVMADEERVIRPDDVREITLRLVPSDNGPRLQTMVEAPGVTFDSLKACLVGEDGKQQTIQVLAVDVDSGKPNAALITLAVPQSLSELTFDQFLIGDTTYDGKAYLIFADGKDVAAGLVHLKGIKVSIFLGIFATVALLSAIAAVRPHPRARLATGVGRVGPFLKGIIVGNSGEASLSLFQIALWTVITIFAMVYVWWRTGAPITLTTDMLGLLGFAAAGSVAARWIAASRSPGGQQSSAPTNEAIRAAVEMSQRQRAEADALRTRAQDLVTAEAKSKEAFEAAVADRTTAEQGLAAREADLEAAQGRKAQAEQKLAANQALVTTADDATKPQAEAAVVIAEAALKSADADITDCQQKIDAARTVIAQADGARQRYEQAIRDAGSAASAQDMAERLAGEAEERVTELRSAGREPKFAEMLMTDGRLDLFKMQLLLFTTLTALYVAARVITDMAFPPIGEGLLLLMGVSNGGYIAAKLAEPSPLQKARALQVDLDALDKRVTTLVAEQKQLQDEDAAIKRSLAAASLPPGAKEAFDARLATISARLASIEKDGKGELPDARAAAAARRKEFQDQLAAATKAAS